MLKFLVIASISVALTYAVYQFQDPEFNQLLYDDLTDAIEKETASVRLKRGTTPDTDQVECKPKSSKKEKEAHCCNGDEPSRNKLEAIKAIKKGCIEETQSTTNEISYDPLSCDGVLVMRQQMACAAECLAKKLGFLVENGEFNRKALLNYTRTIVGNNKWKTDVLEEYVGSCLAEINADKTKSTKSKNAACNSMALDFHHCTWRKFVKGCPADLQIQSRKCKKVRARLASGDNSHSDKSFRSSQRSRSH